jgi:GntR family transcriptional regulator
MTQTKASAVTGSVPRYARLAETIEGGIAAGEFEVGGFLPSEPELAVRYGVSRHTVREAIRRLCEVGLITRHQGIGTRVVAREASSRYVATLATLDEMISFNEKTHLQVFDHAPVAGKELEAFLGAQATEGWTVIHAVRHLTKTGEALCHTDIYLHPFCRKILPHLKKKSVSVYKLIERHCHEKIIEMDQEIDACLLSIGEARALAVEAGSPGSRVVRTYLGTGNRILSFAINTYPQGKFRFALRWTLEQGQ